MGLKRLGIALEVTFPEDVTDTLDSLSAVTAQAIGDGVMVIGGTLARISVLSAAEDPDREPSVDDPGWVPPVKPVEPESVQDADL